MRKTTKLLGRLDKLVPEDSERNVCYKPMRKFTVSRAGGSLNRSRNELLQDVIEVVMRLRMSDLAVARSKEMDNEEVPHHAAASSSSGRRDDFSVAHQHSHEAGKARSDSQPAHVSDSQPAHRPGFPSLKGSDNAVPSLVFDNRNLAVSVSGTLSVEGASSSLDAAGQAQGDADRRPHSDIPRHFTYAAPPSGAGDSSSSAGPSAWFENLERHLEAVDQVGVPLGDVHECVRQLSTRDPEHPP
eukprot:1012283-Rhodomonas_salina.2